MMPTSSKLRRSDFSLVSTTPVRIVGTSVALAVAGLIFGALVSAANHSPGLLVASKVVGVGWSWAALGIIVALATKRRPTAIVASVLVAAVAGYYISEVSIGVYTTINFDSPLTYIDPANAPQVVLWSGVLVDFTAWTAVAILVSHPLAIIGAATARLDAWGLVARMVIPIGASTEMLILKLPFELAVQPNLTTVRTYLSVAIVGLGAAAILYLLHLRYIRTHADTPSITDVL